VPVAVTTVAPEPPVPTLIVNELSLPDKGIVVLPVNNPPAPPPPPAALPVAAPPPPPPATTRYCSTTTGGVNVIPPLIDIPENVIAIFVPNYYCIFS
jgi:hypothetical protein